MLVPLQADIRSAEPLAPPARRVASLAALPTIRVGSACQVAPPQKGGGGRNAAPAVSLPASLRSSELLTLPVGWVIPGLVRKIVGLGSYNRAQRQKGIKVVENCL